jgi:hypoxanthine phosphoribosyltransferase
MVEKAKRRVKIKFTQKVFAFQPSSKNSHPMCAEKSDLIILSWEEFSQAVTRLSDQLRSRHFSCIYGAPRGGLVLAVALSHHLDIPLSLSPAPNMLWCDDIVDTGTTYLQALKEYPKATFCVWVAKAYISQVIHALDLSHKKEWVLFPGNP